MATLYPNIDEILKQKVKPQPGEIHLLKFLEASLDESFEVFFNPYMNGDRPDVVIMRRGYGVLIIEVKDYKLNLYELDERKNWKLKFSEQKVKSPISQVLRYKDNLFELHVEKLLEMKIRDIRKFNVVTTAVYFHNASQHEIKELIVTPFELDRKYQDFLKYNIELIGNDNLNQSDLNTLLRKRYLQAERESFLFTEDIYLGIKRLLKPPFHSIDEGKKIPYSRKQLEIIYEQNQLQQRVKGVVGSGKTTVLAARAVQAHRRSKGHVLILTYNITLKNFIKDRISDVREDFDWSFFVINNYHLFINSELNNLGVVIDAPDQSEGLTARQLEKYFETHYYSNKRLFEKYKDEIIKYDVILIDEIQDYKRPWMEILKEYFLVENGEYILFGDVKQNIYNNTTENKDVSANVSSVKELKNCFRSDFKIKDLAIQFQKQVFGGKYETDSFNKVNEIQTSFEFKQIKQGSVNYLYLPEANNIESLYTIIQQNSVAKNVHPNDITILGETTKLLKEFDAYYRYRSMEKTNTMLETFELVYKMGFNYITKPEPDWFITGLKLLNHHGGNQRDKGLNRLSVLFVIYDLRKKYGNVFKLALEYYTRKFNTTVELFLAFREKYNEEIELFKINYSADRQSKSIAKIRKNKKIHFHMNSGTIKVSTVHSFKGWETDTLFLILEDYYEDLENEFSQSFDEILYTGITRSKSNLILIDYGNSKYHETLLEIVKSVN